MSKIRIGLPSKGRLKEESIKLFSSKNLSIHNANSRNYFFNFEENKNFDGIFLHAREIIERLNDGTLDVGISGLDLLNESEKNLQDKINQGYVLDVFPYRRAKSFRRGIDSQIEVFSD